MLNGTLVPYYLDESRSWGLSVADLDSQLRAAKESGVEVRALVVINPGNPTGQLLDEDNMRDIARWCRDANVCLMADEVYQENVWKPEGKFVSFRKVAYDNKLFDGENPLQLVSFHSVSKGFFGECGLRGGYMELLGFEDGVRQELLKLASISLCSNSIGQVTTGLMVRPPMPGEASYAEFAAEREAILSSMKRRAVKLSALLNKLEGVSCNAIDGAMYAFPTITLPKKACDAARAAGVEPDALYCMKLLERTGIVVVPGSGFGQKEGTLHFRTTMLPPEDQIDNVVRLLSKFHAEFLAEYA